MKAMEIKLKALTPLWTGGVDQRPDRLHETGLIGSLRWWYEALVRGLGGYACDPTTDSRCEYNPKDPRPSEKQLCAACYLFGCTGWGRKFRLRVLDADSLPVKDALKENTGFILEFTELREMRDEEKWVLAKAVEIAARYGALGGKTTLKPQRKRRAGADYGVVEWVEGGIKVDKPPDLQNFIGQFPQRKVSGFPDLRWFFFFTGAFLWRRQMNTLLGLNERGKPIPHADDVQKFLQGRRGYGNELAVSKKLFSSRAGGGRIWGYARDAKMRDEVIRRIKQQLGEEEFTVRTGEEVLNEL